MLSSDSGIKKVVKYSDWMNDDDESTNKKKKKVVGKLEAMSAASEEDRANYDSVFEKQRYEGTKGHLLLQLQKSYKGDERF